MNELIEWVIEIEGTASRIYEKAAAHFSDDVTFSEFLMGLSRDEGHLSFFKDNNIRHLRKPASIIDIKKAVIDILRK